MIIVKGSNLKEKIAFLRENGKSYNEISKILNCSKATIGYHCKNLNINKPIRGEHLTKEDAENIKILCENRTIKEVSELLKRSPTTIKKYKNLETKSLQTNEEKKRKNYERVKHRRQAIKIKAVNYKGGKCELCGYKKCIWALDFHHKNPKEKDFSIAQNSTFKWEKIKLELDKCIMICSNCHREKHYEEYIKTNGQVTQPG